MKRIPVLILMALLANCNVFGQEAQTGPQREVTLYNVYKPTLSRSNKRSFLPVINDTLSVKPKMTYDIVTKPFFPEYKISPLKAATLVADPLPKLYKSYINLGFGNYFTPFGELSIANERSKKGAIGLYARHFSTNGNVKLDSGDKVFAGYMDNDLSLFGKRFLDNSVLEGSIDYEQKTRHAYGFNTDSLSSILVLPGRKATKTVFNGIGADISWSSLTLDSADLNYKINLGYNLFAQKDNTYQQNEKLGVQLAKSFDGFYAQVGVGFDFYHTNDSSILPEYTLSIHPSVSKNTPLWNFRVGANLVYDRDGYYATTLPPSGGDVNERFYVYPDLKFGFSIMPTYMEMFLGLNGELNKNMVRSVVGENPYSRNLFLEKNTDYSLVASAGLDGNNGIGGNWLLSASYSIVDNMLFFVADENSDSFGRYFTSIYDDVDLLNIHGEIDGDISDKLSFNGSANLYKYTLADNISAPNKPDWEAEFGLKYNLRDKIIAGIDVNAIGARTLSSNTFADQLAGTGTPVLTTPTHVNINFNAEYRYTKILSFWFKANNLGFNRYYDYAYYPTQRFLFMLGFSYSM